MWLRPRPLRPHINPGLWKPNLHPIRMAGVSKRGDLKLTWNINNLTTGCGAGGKAVLSSMSLLLLNEVHPTVNPNHHWVLDKSV